MDQYPHPAATEAPLPNTAATLSASAFSIISLTLKLRGTHALLKLRSSSIVTSIRPCAYKTHYCFETSYKVRSCLRRSCLGHNRDT